MSIPQQPIHPIHSQPLHTKSGVNNWIQLLRTPTGFLWFSGIMVFPFYIFGAGKPQISTFIMLAAAIPLLVTRPGIPPYMQRLSEKATIPLFFFVGYAFLLQFCWVVYLLQPPLLIFPAYYIYNAILVFSFLRYLLRHESGGEFFAHAILLSVLLQTLLSFAVGFGEYRNHLFFTNPNQLGFFALLSAGALTIAVRAKHVTPVKFGVGMLCCIWLGQLSLSKSAMIAGILLLLYGGARSKTALIVLALLSIGLSIGGSTVLNERYLAVEDRLSLVGKASDDNLAARGYDRIAEHPEMNILGGGEGANERWTSFLDDAELHSTWGTLLFCYGLPGLFFFSLFFVRASRILGTTSLIVMSSIAFYGLTHNGLRFVPFWLLTAYIFSIAIHAKRNQKVESYKKLQRDKRLVNQE